MHISDHFSDFIPSIYILFSNFFAQFRSLLFLLLSFQNFKRTCTVSSNMYKRVFEMYIQLTFVDENPR